MKVLLKVSITIFALLTFHIVSISYAESVKFIHTDHLGSTGLATDENGELSSSQVYYPYGATRNDTGPHPTERQYTGQISDQDQTGLYYYNARYYDSLTAKFTQADSTSDQINRYTYVSNNPVKLIDPTGNFDDYPDSVPEYDYSSYKPKKRTDNRVILLRIFKELSQEQLDDGYKAQAWTQPEINAINEELWNIAVKIARTINSLFRSNSDYCRIEGYSFCSGYGRTDPVSAFYLVFGGPVNIFRSKVSLEQKEEEANSYAGGVRNNTDIYIYNVRYKDSVTSNYVATHSRIFTHEMGHAFKNMLFSGVNINPNSFMTGKLKRSEYRDKDTGSTFGFAGGFESWQFAVVMESGEVFADMFVGWVYDKWEVDSVGRLTELGRYRQQFMDTKMKEWLAELWMGSN